MVPKLKVTIVHALANDAAMAAYGVNWWFRRESASKGLEGWNVAASLVAMGSVLFAGYLGAVLTYEHGVGLNIWAGRGRKRE